MKNKTKILLLDIETSPLETLTWGTFDQNIALNQIKKEWNVIAWCAKWLDSNKTIYQDNRHAKDVRDDKDLLKQIHSLIDEADVLVTQNGKNFDLKKLNARFIINGYKPPSPCQHIDTLKIAKKHFGFTSNKLEWMTNTLCKKNKKLTHKKFPGFTLWTECLNGNVQAWNEMRAYNVADVLSLEELYLKLRAWGNDSVNLNVFNEDKEVCNCGSSKLVKRGFAFSKAGKFHRFQCQSCGAWKQGKENLIPKQVRQGMLK